MASQKHPGLFKVTAQRTTVRNDAGDFFIGSLFAGEYFYAERAHPGDHQWVWGYGGEQFRDFGWVRLEHRLVQAHHRKDISNNYEQKIAHFLQQRGHRRNPIEHYALATGPGLPPPGSTTATGIIHLESSTPFYLNHSHGKGKNDGWASLPAMVNPGNKVSWRYFTKDHMHAVVYHPLGYPLAGHGKWGFIKSDNRIASIELVVPQPTRTWRPGQATSS